MPCRAGRWRAVRDDDAGRHAAGRPAARRRPPRHPADAQPRPGPPRRPPRPPRADRARRSSASAGELSKVLDHIEKIGELGDLDDVAPTSHVIDVENALRADEPRPSLPRRARARGRARRRPPAASACRARGAAVRPARADRRPGRRADPAGELDAGEYFELLPRSAPPADDLNAFTWVAERRAARSTPAAPLGGVPVAIKDLFCTEGIPSQAGSRILEGYRPPYTATARPRLSTRARRCSARPTRTSSRWAPRPRTPPTGRR